MTKLLRIQDERTTFLRWSVSNETLCCQLALCQLVIALVSLAQHIFSLARHHQIFLCHFNRTAAFHNTEYSSFLAYDVIIFDFGLFHEILGVQECIANYIDGGYMRCLWCIGQTMAIIVLVAVPCLARVPPPWLLWPMLTMESVYCIGLIIFTIAITDKLVHAILHDLSGHLVWLALIYWLGAATNCFLNYILWHFYWHLEEQYKLFKNEKKNVDSGTDDETDGMIPDQPNGSIQFDSEEDDDEMTRPPRKKQQILSISNKEMKQNGYVKPIAL